MTGASAVGIDLVLMNTGLSSGQLALVASQPGLPALIHDDEFDGVVSELPDSITVTPEGDWVIELDAAPPANRLDPPARGGRTIILTSGTTGTPKSAARKTPGGFGPLISIIERIPLRAQDRTLISAPIFHTWGYAAMQLSFARGPQSCSSVASTRRLPRTPGDEGVPRDVRRPRDAPADDGAARPPGGRKGRKDLRAGRDLADLSDALHRSRRWSSAHAREHLVRDAFLSLSGGDLTRFKSLLGSGADHRDLEHLVFEVVDDEGARRDILDHIAAEAAGVEVPDLHVLSDIDDTLRCALHDDRYPRGTVYPGVIALYRALDAGHSADPERPGDLTFVTARPMDPAGLIEQHTRRGLRDLGLPPHACCRAPSGGCAATTRWRAPRS